MDHPTNATRSYLLTNYHYLMPVTLGSVHNHKAASLYVFVNVQIGQSLSLSPSFFGGLIQAWDMIVLFFS